MTENRWGLIETLFHRALERAPDDRAAFLDKACGEDAGLRAEIDSLLEAHSGDEAVIDLPMEDLAAGLFSGRTLIGRTIGRYRIRSLLGAGGMGEVYRAKDMRLGREVAVKILSAHLSWDEEALRRFEREVQAVAALSHPNILSIYDVGSEEGFHYAVTELLEGETLRACIERGPMPWREAVDICLKIGEGLSAAHARGIIHRDLKPENIYLTHDGQVKILDFGIARIKPAFYYDAETLNPTTRRTASTSPGVLIGTIGYMSPEQLRSEAAEAPSDLFALGCVLYECVSGKHPFERATQIETMAAILHEDPAPPDLSAEIPEALDAVIRRCLEKSAAARFLSARDLCDELQKIAAVSHPTASRFQFENRSLIAAAVILALISALVASWFQLRNPADAEAPRFDVAQLTLTGNIDCSAISPKGDFAAYATRENARQSSLWIQQLATSTRRAVLAGIEARLISATFSPDGNFIYYSARLSPQASSTLYRVSVLGGPPVKVLDGVETRITFSPDQKHIAFRRSDPERRRSIMVIADIDGGSEREAASISYPERFFDPAWSSDGKQIVCAAGVAVGTRNMYVVSINPDDGSWRPVTVDRWEWVGQISFLPDGALMMVAQDRPGEVFQIWRLHPVTGKARKVTNDSRGWNRVSVAADGRSFVAQQSQLVTNLWIYPREGGFGRQVTFGAGGYRAGISWTPDGRILVDTNTNGVTAVSRIEADGSDLRQLTGEQFGREMIGGATATPDGKYVLFASEVEGARNLWRMKPDGTDAVRLTSGRGEEHPGVTPDGRWVIFTRMEQPGQRGPALWRVSIDGGEPQRFADSPSIFPAVSPDGAMVACLQRSETDVEIWRPAVYPIEGGAPLKIFPQPVSPRAVRWTRDGLGITYAENPDADRARILVQPLDGGRPQLIAEFETDRVFGFDWSFDGRSLACIRGAWTGNLVWLYEQNTNRGIRGH